MTNEAQAPATAPSAGPDQLIAPPVPLPGTAKSDTTGGGVQGVGAGVTVAQAVLDDDAARQEFLWHTHGYLNEYARFADSKAAFAGTLAGALLAALYGAHAHVPLVTTAPLTWGLAAWLTLFAALALAGSVGLAAWIVAPRLGSSQTTGFIYWQSVASHGTRDKLQAAFIGQSIRDLNEHILGHIFDLSVKVCIPKYRWARLCIWCLLAGGVLAAAALIVGDASVPATAPLPPAKP